jgi:hypothetical protein
MRYTHEQLVEMRAWELKQLVAELGVAVPLGASKARMIAALEPTAVAAQPVETAERKPKTPKQMTATELRAECDGRGMRYPMGASRAKMLELLGAEGKAEEPRPTVTLAPRDEGAYETAELAQRNCTDKQRVYVVHSDRDWYVPGRTNQEAVANYAKACGITATVVK